MLADAPPPTPATDNESVRAGEMAVALRNGLKMGGSLLITWTVALIVKLRVPAHLGPVRQGHFGFAESFAAMLFAAIGLGIDTYLIKEVAVRPSHASDVVGGVFVLRALMSVVLLLAIGCVLGLTGRPQDILVAALVFGVINLLMTTNATLGAVLAAISRVGPSVIANIATKIVWGVGLLIGLKYNAPLPVLALPGLVGELLRLAIILPATRIEAGLQFRIDVPAVRVALIESAPYFVNGLALTVLGSLGMSTLEFIRVDEREVGWFAAVKNMADLCGLLTPLLFWVVTPILARAFARSEEEGMAVFRRCLEGLVVAIAPITVLISAGSDVSDPSCIWREVRAGALGTIYPLSRVRNDLYEFDVRSGSNHLATRVASDGHIRRGGASYGVIPPFIRAVGSTPGGRGWRVCRRRCCRRRK